jgi:16S rRNA (uracil1498-N3)-methyltransferase
MVSARCYVPGIDWTAGEVTLDAATSHHVARVLRLRAGDAVTVFDGRGGVGDGVIQAGGKSAVRVQVASRRLDEAPRPRITLVQALLKPQAMDSVMRKACELGVSVVQPVVTGHCVVRTRERPARWEKTMVAAAEQCGTNWVPEVAPVLTWSDWVASLAGREELRLMCALQEARSFRQVVREQAAVPERVTMVVGPEGDFEAAERQAAVAAGCVPVSLGALTLRADTAALMGVAVLRYEWGEFFSS